MAELPKFVVVEKNVDRHSTPTLKTPTRDLEIYEKKHNEQKEILTLLEPLFLQKKKETKEKIQSYRPKEELISDVKIINRENTESVYKIEKPHLSIKINNLIGGEEIESLDLSRYTLKTHTFEGSKKQFSERFIFERITPDGAGAGGGSRKSRRRALKSRRSKAKKSF